jgi:hypothetical protein
MNQQKKEELFRKYEDLLQMKKQQLHQLNSKHETVEKANIHNSLQNIYDYLAKENSGGDDLQKIANEMASLK